MRMGARPRLSCPQGAPIHGAMLFGRLVRLLIVFAMLFAPVGIAGGHAAMAQAAAAHAAGMEMTEHCAGQEQRQEQQQPVNGCGCVADCAVAWSVLPDLSTTMAAHPVAEAMRQRLRPAAALDGLHPESEPPPPRAA